MTESYEKEHYWKLVQEFITELKTAKYWLKPDGKPLNGWMLFEAETLDAARGAARDAARGAARDAASDAACDAAWGAARCAARCAASDAACDAAWGAAYDAAWGAACDAACDAAIFARMLVCEDLPMDRKHLDHLNARMRVWRKGYYLLCDVNGKLYVYATKNKKTDSSEEANKNDTTRVLD